MTAADRTEPRPLAFLLGNAAFVLVEVLVAAWAAWPIYGSGNFVVLVAVSFVLGAAIALLGYRRALGWLTVCALALGTFLVVGVPLAVPTALTGLAEFFGGWLALVRGTVFSWKELATITTLPVGSYQSLLVPALVVFLFGAVATLSIAWRSPRVWAIVVPIALVMQGFGLVFGSAATSAPTTAFGLPVTAPRELLIGVAGFFVSLAFLLWRVQFARRAAVQRAQSLAGIRQNRQGAATLLRRLALAAIVLVVAVVVGAGLSPALGSAADRSVLRSSIDPATHEKLAESPLAEYREYFSADRYDADLFRIDANSLPGARLRLAVMSYYDGTTYRVVDPVAGGTSDSAFVRVPYRLDPGTSGTTGSVTITVGDYDGVWLPTVANLEQLKFTGSKAQAHSDDFFYNAPTASGIELDGVATGERYTVQAVRPGSALELAAITKPATAANAIDPSLLPKNLVQWVKQQAVTTDATGLAELVTRLRERGYLSHALIAPTDGSTPAWMTDAGIQSLEPSYAGHSLDRIDALFGQLVDKQNDSPADAASPQLVAAIGDDEQFAVAAALLAQYQGFPSRVVLGFDLDGSDRTADEVPACAETCKGKNLTAWIEVQDASGAWVTVDTTPQHSSPVDTTTSELQPPKKPTTVLPDAATEQQPPAADPSGGETTKNTTDEQHADLTWLVTLLKTVGISLLAVVVLLAPFAAILLAKARRRRERRHSGPAEQRIVGGWDEYVDVALDHGLPVPTTETRSQVAAGYQTPNGSTLALLADRAVFGPVDVADAEGERFWQLLESERLAFDRGASRWRRLRAALSLRSFTRYVRSRPLRGPEIDKVTSP